MNGPDHFDAEYYARFYGDPKTRVTAAAEVGRLVAFVAAYLNYLQLPVRRVLDIGCGTGLWQAPLKHAFPNARYTGVEYSRYICRTHGWTHGSVIDYAGRGRFDLLICQGVLQYLTPSDCEAAVENLARLCRGALYLEVLSQEDWDHNCDQSVTDGAVYLRSAASYRRLLSRHFISAGGGLFVARTAPVTLYELEKLE